ncbi:carbon-nitrogen hydrolase family protein [Spectribacter hydrogenoxidans]|uniref:Carbon-nitrogen hydrolase family protein n=1 Tax=Spectribacter hydrogenoxidans TaxID=3075608 RepID=A0ABU3BZ10_9GAMM|nr:carbon-nitrogen hydrolase family protein [Salinisphaera sp. W335]MDT0634553.1 carbon-nitrogen hydrolase family protein [Salinisphaera sp. W335]
MPNAAAIQMVSGADRDRNLAAAGELIRRAADAGARLVVLPENFAFMGKRESDKLRIAEPDGSGPIQDFLADAAAASKVWLVGGTLPIRGNDRSDRAFATCPVYAEDGARVARFDKIHLFDVSVPDTGEQYKESGSTIPGTEPVVIDTPLGRLGLTVCYDLRFPELYRHLSAAGAELLAVPAAFTAATGRAHWEVLVRARAIENLCYVIAPDQGGRHASGRETHGDSMIVDPWGRVLDRVAAGPGLAMADVDVAGLLRTRERFPALTHRRL